MGDGVGIVIPAYRPDPERLRRYIQRISRELAPERIHVELDVPSDAVVSALESAPATISVADTRRGKGAAITAGFDAVGTPVLAFVDADGSTPADSLSAVLEPVRNGSANLAVGSRRHPDANVTMHQTLFRRRLGDIFVRIARFVLPVRLYDYQCGAKAIDRETWAAVREELVSPGFAWDIELVALSAALDAEIVEIPITWEDRPGSTVPMFGTSSEFAAGLLRARHSAKRLRGDRLHSTIARLVPAGPALVERRDRSLSDPGREDV